VRWNGATGQNARWIASIVPRRATHRAARTPRRPWGTLVPKRSDEARTAPQLAVNAVIKGETFDRFGVTRGRDNDDLR